MHRYYKPIANNKKYNTRNKVITFRSMKCLKSLVRERTFKKYLTDIHSLNKKIIANIIFNEKSHMVAIFKDYLIFDDLSEFLKRFYKIEEAKQRLPQIIQYYGNYSKIFPNYTILSEAKYIYKNIQKKQKVIDNIQNYQDKKLIINEELKVFDTDIYESIMNQTETQVAEKETSLLNVVYKEDLNQQVHVFRQENTCESIERLIDHIKDAGAQDKGNKQFNKTDENNSAPTKMKTNNDLDQNDDFEFLLLEKKMKEIKNKNLEKNEKSDLSPLRDTAKQINNGSTLYSTANPSVINSRPLGSSKNKLLSIGSIANFNMNINYAVKDIPQSARSRKESTIPSINNTIFAGSQSNHTINKQKFTALLSQNENAHYNPNYKIVIPYKEKNMFKKVNNFNNFNPKPDINFPSKNKLTITQKDFISTKNINKNTISTARLSDRYKIINKNSGIKNTKNEANVITNNTFFHSDKKNSNANTLTRSVSLFKTNLATIQPSSSIKTQGFNLNIAQITHKSPSVLNTERQPSSGRKKIRKISSVVERNQKDYATLSVSPNPNTRNLHQNSISNLHRKTNSTHVLDLKLKMAKPTKPKLNSNINIVTNSNLSKSIKKNVIPPIKNFKELIKQSTLLPTAYSDRNRVVRPNIKI